ncbi:MAG: NYN domain-containing protein [Candidatus Babeliaceae bacterium]|nr:NYN domain-containing protein [Candidatus Babeliaceae bacterium]
MNIFIDAYNLLKQLHAVKLVSAHQKNTFIDELKQFARNKGHHIYLVYDGGESFRPESDHIGPITIIHSGHRLSADEVIKQKILNFAHEHTILVSDDRQLCDYVAMSGFAALGTANFYKLIKADIQKEQRAFIEKSIAHKNPYYSSNPELDELMHEAGSVGYYKDIELCEESHHPQRLSKKEKKLKKLVKKL